MSIEKFREHIQDLVEDLQLHVWLGTMSRYNTREQISDRELIIEPFAMPLYNDYSCKISVNVNMSVAIRRSIDREFISLEKGDDAAFIDYIKDIAKQVYAALNTSNHIRIMATENDISTNYFEADSNASLMSQAFLRFTLPIKIYGLR